MKRITIAAVLAALIASHAIAATQSLTTEKNKIGGYVGGPFGFSYSRKLSPLIEFDILAGLDSTSFHSKAGNTEYQIFGLVFSLRTAVLFRCWEGKLWPGACGKLSIGPAVGFFAGGELGEKNYPVGGFTVSAPVRFEIDFSFPFNLFAELNPVGVQVSFMNADGTAVNGVSYYIRGGVGLRYRF